MSIKKNQTGKSVRFFTPARLASTALVLSLLAAFGASSCNSNDHIVRTKDPAPKISVSPSRPSPATTNVLPPELHNVELKAVKGAPIKLSDYGGKVLLLNLWATWCGPCRLEIPELVKFHKEYRGRGLEVVGLSTENAEASAAGVKKFVHEYDMGYRVGWAPPQVSMTLMQGNNAIPQSFLISRDGRILKRFIGFNRASTPPELKQAIEEALKG